MSSIVKDKYKFEYQSGITQFKWLVSEEDYQNQLKPLLDEMYEQKNLPKKKQNYLIMNEIKQNILGLIGELDPVYEIFREGDTYHQAIETGKISPRFIGDGFHNVKITKV